VFTQNISKAYRFVEELAVGQVVVNDSTCWWDINMPFGGAGGRRTGWGRIGGKHTLLGMTDLRTAAIQLLSAAAGALTNFDRTPDNLNCALVDRSSSGGSYGRVRR
jgi:hypothetical protein